MNKSLAAVIELAKKKAGGGASGIVVETGGLRRVAFSQATSRVAAAEKLRGLPWHQWRRQRRAGAARGRPRSFLLWSPSAVAVADTLTSISFSFRSHLIDEAPYSTPSLSAARFSASPIIVSHQLLTLALARGSGDATSR